MVNLILKMYAELWFRIEYRPQVQNGPTHLFQMLNALQDFDYSRVSTVLAPVIQINALFAHPESVLLAMFLDERPHVRGLAWRRSKKAM